MAGWVFVGHFIAALIARITLESFITAALTIVQAGAELVGPHVSGGSPVVVADLCLAIFSAFRPS